MFATKTRSTLTRRPLAVESLPRRELMASDVFATVQPADDISSEEQVMVSRLDVNQDGIVSPRDANAVLTYLNRGADEVLPPVFPAHLDVDGNNQIQPLDALLILNHLNQNNISQDNFSQEETQQNNTPQNMVVYPGPAFDWSSDLLDDEQLEALLQR